MNQRTYCSWTQLNPADICVTLGPDKNGKPTIRMYVGTNAADVALMSPACMTHWPRCTGNGNFGTLWGPSDIGKARYTLDLSDTCINGKPNEEFEQLARLMDAIDDKLLDFVHNEQVRILGRRQLSREEVKMLQVRTVRTKYDRNTGVLSGHSINLTAAKYVSDGMGSKYERKIPVCDYSGVVQKEAVVAPGDVVAATMYISTVYTGMGGDKFGISWGLGEVAVICQRAKMLESHEVSIFQSLPCYDFASQYDDSLAKQTDCFSDGTAE